MLLFIAGAEMDTPDGEFNQQHKENTSITKKHSYSISCSSVSSSASSELSSSYHSALESSTDSERISREELKQEYKKHLNDKNDTMTNILLSKSFWCFFQELCSNSIWKFNLKIKRIYFLLFFWKSKTRLLVLFLSKLTPINSVWSNIWSDLFGKKRFQNQYGRRSEIMENLYDVIDRIVGDQSIF